MSRPAVGAFPEQTKQDGRSRWIRDACDAAPERCVHPVWINQKLHVVEIECVVMYASRGTGARRALVVTGRRVAVRRERRPSQSEVVPVACVPPPDPRFDDGHTE